MCGSRGALGKIKAKTIDERLKKRGVAALNVITGRTVKAMEVAYPYIEKIIRTKGRVKTDKKPDFPGIAKISKGKSR